MQNMQNYARKSAENMQIICKQNANLYFKYAEYAIKYAKNITQYITQKCKE